MSKQNRKQIRVTISDSDFDKFIALKKKTEKEINILLSDSQFASNLIRKLLNQ